MRWDHKTCLNCGATYNGDRYHSCRELLKTLQDQIEFLKDELNVLQRKYRDALSMVIIPAGPEPEGEKMKVTRGAE